MARSPLTPALLDRQNAALGLAPYGGPDDPGQMRRAALAAVLAARAAGTEPMPPVLRGAVRALLDRLAERAPGRSVEVRVPPYAAVQCIDGPHHTRGTPPNVVEMDADTWIGLAVGELTWDEAMKTGRIRAGGPRADLAAHLPLLPG